jgi:RimJ/RimL family protein N-acetyltransferase
MVAFRSRDRAEFDQHWAKILADNSCLKKTIVVVSAVSADSSAHQVAGNIGSWLSDGKREIGYWIDRALWGRGIATEALSAFLRLEQTRPLHAGVATHNAASIRVLQNAGSPYSARRKQLPMTPNLRTFSYGDFAYRNSRRLNSQLLVRFPSGFAVYPSCCHACLCSRS